MLMLTIVMMPVMTACGGSSSPDPVENGEACELAEDCAGGTCLTALGEGVADNPMVFPDGYCTNECSWDSSGQDVGCDAETEGCLQYNLTGEQYCFQQGCVSDADCREGYTCTPVGFWVVDNFCLPSQDSSARETQPEQNQEELYSRNEVYTE